MNWHEQEGPPLLITERLCLWAACMPLSAGHVAGLPLGWRLLAVGSY